MANPYPLSQYPNTGASANTRDNTDMGVETSNSAAFSCESGGYLFEQVDEDEFDIYSDENVYFSEPKILRPILPDHLSIEPLQPAAATLEMEQSLLSSRENLEKPCTSFDASEVLMDAQAQDLHDLDVEHIQSPSPTDGSDAPLPSTSPQVEEGPHTPGLAWGLGGTNMLWYLIFGSAIAAVAQYTIKEAFRA